MPQKSYHEAVRIAWEKIEARAHLSLYDMAAALTYDRDRMRFLDDARKVIGSSTSLWESSAERTSKERLEVVQKALKLPIRTKGAPICLVDEVTP